MTPNAPGQPASTLGAELKRTARLGVPLALGELGWMSTYIVDALMVGRMAHSALAISASSLGNTIFYTIAFCAIRLLTGLDTLVAQASGRGEDRECVRMLAQAMWIVLGGMAIVIPLTLLAIPLLPHFGTPSAIVVETSVYLHSLVWSTPPLLVYWAIRQYLQAKGQTVLIMISLLTASAINLVADWALIYGHLGMHAYGIAGSGFASCTVRVWMVFIIAPALFRDLRRSGERIRGALLRVDWKRMGTQLRIGWPAAVQNITDLGFSTFMSIVCARLGATVLAGHQVTLDLDAFIYQVPAGIAYATITRVGQAAGRDSVPQVVRSMHASMILCLGYVAAAASLFAGFARFWASLYTNDVQVVAIAAPVFLICAFIQIGDGAAVILASAMTGLGDTRTPLVANTAWYWLAGMPLSWWLAFDAGWGLRGLWLGRAIAALGTAATLTGLWRLRVRRMRQTEGSGGLSLLNSRLNEAVVGSRIS